MKISIVFCLHGNEKYGLEVAKQLPAIPSFLANERALKENKRFIDVDMNRCFPGKEDGNYEEKEAFHLLEKLKEFDYVIDLHSSSNNCPLFGIITDPNRDKIELAKKLGLDKLVIMSPSFASGKALIDFVVCGISLEIGPHDGSENVKEVSQVINNLVREKNYNENLKLFEVVGVIKKEAEDTLIKNFDNVFKGQVIAEGKIEQRAEFDFIPVLVDEGAYDGLLCLACNEVNPEKFYKSHFLL